MKKLKKLFTFIMMAFSLMGIFFGSVLAGQTDQPMPQEASADFSSYDKISNSLPIYLKVDEKTGNDINEIFLQSSAGDQIDISIAKDLYIAKTTGGTTYQNPAYFTEEINDGDIPEEFYYFSFTNALSLYHNLSNTEIQNGATGKNLLEGRPITDYTSFGFGTYSGFAVDAGGYFTPQKLDLSLSLNTINQKVDFGGNKITLNKEGLYTLAIPVVVYHTTNNGATFTSLEEQTIYYTFMMFNSDTYFKNVGDQNIQNVSFENAQMSNALSSDKYSKYYFFNYSSAQEGALPLLQYNHTLFKVNIKYYDIDGYSESIFIEFQNGELVYLNNAGYKLENPDYLPFSACVTNDGQNGTPNTRVVFKNLGEYDVAFDYLYIVQHDAQTTVTYNVPIDENETAEYKDKNQKLYIYGYQAMFADYSTLDPETNQTKDAELRTFELGPEQAGKYRKSADITSAVNYYYASQNGTNLGDIKTSTTVVNKSEDYDESDLLQWAEKYINDNNVEPVSTNQPPIKFVTNAKNANSKDSKIYKMIKDGNNYAAAENTNDDPNPTSFQGFNQNSEGTYLYIIQYSYDGYMTPSGTLNSAQTHYQIFFFTVTSTVPSVTVTAADYDESSGEYINFKTIYTRGFTNKTVFILNNAKNNDFDAEVKIKITAYNYLNGAYIHDKTPIEELVNKDTTLEYIGYEYDWDNNTATPDEIKYGILIKDTPDHNAKWTITIESATTQTPSVQSFTIDKTPISGVKADNANKTDSSYYIRDVEMQTTFTNRPIAMSWAEKKSGAATYGYLKHIPFTQFSWVPEDQVILSNLLQQLIDEKKLLPTSSEIVLEGANYSWGSYANASYDQYENRIPSTLVKEENGIYILQVYDQAGNYTFKIFMIDKTESVFVQVTESDFSTYQLITNGTSLSVPKSEFDQVFIKWGSYKGIHLKGKTLEATEYAGYEHSGIENASFEKEFTEFINNNSAFVQGLSYSNPEGDYIVSKISDLAYVKEQGKTVYSPYTTTDHSYMVDFFQDITLNGKQETIAREGTCKILLQDESNGYRYGDTYLSYINHPSSYISFNVTSDLTKFTILDGGQAIEGEAAFHITDLYKDASGNLTTDSQYTQTSYRKKFSYLPSLNTTNTLSISFHPAVDNGLKLGFVNVQYYPYETARETDVIDVGTFYHFYKSIASTPSLDLTMFEWEDGYTSESVVTLDLAFGQTTRPSAGKYVITRQYVDDDTLANTITEAYDFFCRTMTFFVDTNGIVTSLEEVSATKDGTTYTAFESLVGGEILINTHGGNKEGNKDISISFPQMKHFGNNNYLNSGSFFSQSSFAEVDTAVSISRDTNKLPVELYIPKYKYTIKNEKDADNAGVFNNKYKLTYNDYLSYYGNVKIQRTDGANTYEIVLVNGTEEVVYDSGFQSEQDAYNFLDQNLSISAYSLSAEIRFTRPGETKPSKVYVSSQISPDSHLQETNPTTGNNYLQFYACKDSNLGAQSGADKNVQAPAFSEVGKYTVIIYQNSTDTTSSIYGFYVFAFEITSAKPSFDIIDENNFILQSVGTEKLGNEDIEVYYTNSDSLTLRWEDPTDPYFAKVDQSNISVNGNLNHGYTITPSGNVYSMLINPGQGCVKAFTDDTNPSKNGLTLTFQYEGHDDQYYKTTIKKVYFDTQAPTENLDSLMKNTETSTGQIFSTNFQKKEMRVYTDYKGTIFDPTTKDNENKALKESSYITNVNTGVFKNYAFVVDTKFFVKAQAKYFTYNATLNQSVPTDGKTLSDIYFREIEITNYTQSNKNTLLNFSSFSQLGSGNIENVIKFNPGDDEGRYYEIIEVDWAGNRTIYVVYLQNSNVDANAIVYTDSKSMGANEYVKDTEINGSNEAFNIYANSEFSATKMDYNQDPWMFFTANINGVIGTYFTSPDLSDRVYQIINNGNNSLSYVQKEIKDVVAVEKSSSNKHTIRFANRLSGEEKICYLTVMDASLIINKNIEGITETKASISISVPTPQQYASTSTGYIFPVKVRVDQYDADWKGFAQFYQEKYGTWIALNPDNANNHSVSFTYSTSAFANQLIITVDAGQINQKMRFTVVDNFGGESTSIILTGNAIDEDWSTRGDRFYIIQEADGLSYISSDEISYIFNDNLYTVEYNPVGTLNGIESTIKNAPGGIYNNKTGLTTYTFSPEANAQIYDGAFQIRVYDKTEYNDPAVLVKKPIKIYYIRITNTLPHVDKTNDSANASEGTIVFLDKKHENIGEDNIKADTDPKPILKRLEMDGVEYVGNMTTVTTYSRNVTVQYKNGTVLDNSDTESYKKTLTYSGFITADNGQTWTRMDDVEAGQQYTNYIISGEGTYYIIIKYDDPAILSSSFKIFEVTILNSESSYYYMTVFGQKVNKSEGIKYSHDNIEYEVTYIVSLEYADKYNGGLVIHENKELEVVIKKEKTIYLGQSIDGETNPDVPRGTIVTEIYSYECEEAKGQFVVIYIPASNNIVGTLNYELPSRNISLKDGSAQLVVPHRTDEPSFDKLRISFTSYYGVEQNIIKPVVYKLLDGNPVKLDCEVLRSSDNISYITLETAGTYYLQILDSCTPANSQLFTGKQIDGYDFVEITFLPSVPFDVITQDSEGNRVVTAPIQKAIYNSDVTIQLTNISTYFSSSEALNMTATRNGQPVNITPVNHAYTFTQPGYYTVEFNAIASNGVPIRLEKYTFSIISKNESRYAFEFAEFGSYYIEKVMKDGVDVTEDLIEFANFKTIVIGNKRYLSSLSLNYLDQKTGRGRYEVVININNPSYQAVMGSTFSFQLWINMGKPPLTVSIGEGASTSDIIKVTFNPQTLYNTVGDCYIKIGSLREDYTAENIASYGESRSLTISGEGTYYIQVYTLSGQLLYSYKVTKTQPLNSFAIIAIVVGVAAAVAVIIITIKLRKRQKVK